MVVTLNLDCDGKVFSARSDSTGRFLVVGVSSGHCELEIDGRTANQPGQSYGRFYDGVDLLPGITNVLPYTIWMTPLDKQFEVTIPSPTSSEVVIPR